MKLLFDTFPVILFFIAYWWSGQNIYVATGVTIVASIGQVAWAKWKFGKIDKMLLFSLVLVIVFGGATLLLHDPTFIKWKPTVLYWGFTVALIVSDIVMRKNLIRALMEKQISLPDPIWARLNWTWAGFFALMGALNIYVAYHFSEKVWVNFKMFGGIGLMLLFVLAQGIFLSRHVTTEEEKS